VCPLSLGELQSVEFSSFDRQSVTNRRPVRTVARKDQSVGARTYTFAARVEIVVTS
jgi:hypothetical protein